METPSRSIINFPVVVVVEDHDAHKYKLKHLEYIVHMASTGQKAALFMHQNFYCCVSVSIGLADQLRVELIQVFKALPLLAITILTLLLLVVSLTIKYEKPA